MKNRVCRRPLLEVRAKDFAQTLQLANAVWLFEPVVGGLGRSGNRAKLGNCYGPSYPAVLACSQLDRNPYFVWVRKLPVDLFFVFPGNFALMLLTTLLYFAPAGTNPT